MKGLCGNDSSHGHPHTDVVVISGAITMEMIHGEPAKWPDELITTLGAGAAYVSPGPPLGGPPICLD